MAETDWKQTHDDLAGRVEALAVARECQPRETSDWHRAACPGCCTADELRALLATPAPEATRCGSCGPGYRMGDDGCRHTPAPDLPTMVRCDTCGGTGRVEWMIEGDPNVYNPPDDDGKIACPDCITPTVQADAPDRMARLTRTEGGWEFSLDPVGDPPVQRTPRGLVARSAHLDRCDLCKIVITAATRDES